MPYVSSLKLLLVLFGWLLILLGLFGDLRWLSDFGWHYFHPRHPANAQYLGFFKPLLVFAGALFIILILFIKRFLALGEACWRRPAITLAGVLLTALAGYGFVAYVPFHNYPFCMDEYNFFYQAHILSEGKLYLEIAEKFAPFQEQYVVFENGKLFSKYPPGYPALLLLGILLQIPGLINPLIAVATLLVLYTFVVSFSERIYGLLAVLLMATTPYFTAYSASYFSQPTALLLTSLSFLLVRKYELSARPLFLYLGGLTVGYAAMTRPLDCFCLMLPAGSYLLYLLYRQRQLKRLAYPLLTFALMVALFLAYNYAQTGRITIATYPIVQGEFKVIDGQAVGFFDNLVKILAFYADNARESIPSLLGGYFFLPAAMFIPILALWGLFSWGSKWKWALLANVLLLILLYNFHPGTGWSQYGARYYYSGFFAVVVIATIALRGILQRLHNRAVISMLCILMIWTQLAFSVTAVWHYSQRFDVMLAVWKDIAQRSATEPTIVLLNKSSFQRRHASVLEGVRFIDLSDFRRNPFMDPALLITKNSRRLNRNRLRADFPNHRIIDYHYQVLKD